MGELNSDDHYIYHCGQEFLRRNGVAPIVNKKIQNAVLVCDLKNNRMISVHFQGKSFSATVIQVYALTTNAEEAKVKWFYEDQQDLLELTPKKMSFHHRGLERKSRKSRDTWSKWWVWLWCSKWSTAKANRVLSREHTDHSKHPLLITQEMTYTWTSPDGQYWNKIDYGLCSWRWRSSILLVKTRPGAD